MFKSFFYNPAKSDRRLTRKNQAELDILAPRLTLHYTPVFHAVIPHMQ